MRSVGFAKNKLQLLQNQQIDIIMWLINIFNDDMSYYIYGQNLDTVLKCCSLSFSLKILPCEFFHMRFVRIYVIHLLGTYVIHLLGTYVTILCN